MPAIRGRHVWNLNYHSLSIYQENADGDLIDSEGEIYDPETEEDPLPPLLTYCFTQDVTIVGTIQTDRRPVTGRRHRKIVTLDEEYSLDVETLYLKQSEEVNLNAIFNREKYLRLVFRLYDPAYYAHDPADPLDYCELRRARGQTFSIKGRDNEVMTVSAQFIAEEMTQEPPE